jgi:hypothetical protein
MIPNEILWLIIVVLITLSVGWFIAVCIAAYRLFQKEESRDG